MKLRYTPPDGGPVEEYDFEPNKLMTNEAEDIEDLKGVRWESFEEFGRLFLAGNQKAKRAALWVLKKRREPALAFASLLFPMENLIITFTDAEAARYEQSIRENSSLTEEEKETLIQMLDLSQHEGEFKDGVPVLKDRLPPSARPGSTSPRAASRPASKRSAAGRSRTAKKP